jgi:hypothetical protein
MSNRTPWKTEFLTLTRLRKEFRLSPKWIERLGPPDKEMPNPHHHNAAPMQLWRRDRVEKFCKTHEEEYEKQRIAFERRSAQILERRSRKL